ncbi:MAG: diguanylate cyclase [Conexibacter sp.]
MLAIPPQSTTSGQLPRRLLFAATILALGALFAHALTGLGGDASDRFFEDQLYLAIELAAVAACALRALLVRERRVAWSCIAASLASWTAADLLWLLNPDAGYPSSADALYLLFFPLCWAGMALLLADGRERIAARMWIDGLLAALATAAMVVAVAFGTILDGVHETPAAQTVVNLAYPIGDVVMVGFVLIVFATQGWRPGRAWTMLGTSFALGAVADTIYLYQDALGNWQAGSLVDVLWPAAVVLCGWAAWQPMRSVRRIRGYGRQTFTYPTMFASLALGLLAYDHFSRISDASVLLATAALLVAIARAGMTLRENVALLNTTRHEALTDGLTGLPNRRRLMLDLERAMVEGVAGRIRTFAFFDLDGFKGYNDTFGHAAGDMLLGRLASRLADAVTVGGRAYRLGGDEFCVLIEGELADRHALLEACTEALREQGEGFRVGASCGAVTIPEEADSATHALQLADQRMYAAKDDTRTSSRRQTRDVLLQVLREREPELHQHLRGVAALAVAVGRRLELSAEQLDELARAAELHDIGKLAIPDELLHKPGPLDEDEWELMRQHTIIGDRILAAAPAMRPVAAIVRASHERWDGDGYPDGVAGEAIPLGARIVAVCDAFHAMTNARPYRGQLDREAALAELRRCAGSQFDADVVAVFEQIALSGADMPSAIAS